METILEKIDRLEQMVAENPKWDLSNNDIEAIRTALDALKREVALTVLVAK